MSEQQVPDEPTDDAQAPTVEEIEMDWATLFCESDGETG